MDEGAAMDGSSCDYLPPVLRVSSRGVCGVPCDAVVLPMNTRLRPRFGHPLATCRRAGPALAEQCQAALHCIALQSATHGGRTGFTSAAELAEVRAEVAVSAAIVAPCCARTLPALRVIAAATPFAARLAFLGACTTAVRELVNNVLAAARGAGLRTVALPMRLWEDPVTLSAGRSHARRQLREKRQRRQHRQAAAAAAAAAGAGPGDGQEAPARGVPARGGGVVAVADEEEAEAEEEEEAVRGGRADVICDGMLDAPSPAALEHIYATCARAATDALARFLAAHPSAFDAITLCREDEGMEGVAHEGSSPSPLPLAMVNADRRAARCWERCLWQTFGAVAGEGGRQGAEGEEVVGAGEGGACSLLQQHARWARLSPASSDMLAPGQPVVVDSAGAARVAGEAAAASAIDGEVEPARPIRITVCPSAAAAAPTADACAAAPLAQARSGSFPMVGDRCTVGPAARSGVVAYVGCGGGGGVRVGVRLDQPVTGGSDGRAAAAPGAGGGGERLFACAAGHGVFAQPEDVAVVAAAAASRPGPMITEDEWAAASRPGGTTRLLGRSQAAVLCPADQVLPPLVVSIERVSVVGTMGRRHHEFHTRLEFSLKSGVGGGGGGGGGRLERVSVRVPRRYREFQALREALCCAEGKFGAKTAAEKAVRAEADLAAQSQIKVLPFPAATDWISVKKKLGGVACDFAMGMGAALSASAPPAARRGAAGSTPNPNGRHVTASSSRVPSGGAHFFGRERIARSRSEARRVAERWVGLEAWLQTLVALRDDDPCSHVRRAALSLPPRAGTGDRATRGATLKCLLGFFGVGTSAHPQLDLRPPANAGWNTAEQQFPTPCKVGSALDEHMKHMKHGRRGKPALGNITNTLQDSLDALGN